ncbi:hypothetical protein PPYR_07911 [Photinus pyralis]|uniref:Death domain-containing protein n=2 Tax=Photinus pyralis TaxID=7054 RepID=A0A5N4ARS7_PHOPY|nr:uncharacterized protein LOC116169193 [Photinus pyralis]KAB0800031.1 hypothetical protein PPYR_07911 [Photinus pyralis]
MWHIQKLLLIFTYNYLSWATIDLNIAEFQYLADHLHPEECRRLVASLHFSSYKEPKALDVAEENVSKDIPCIRLLLHWNSQKGEGKGETHEVVQHRLRQLGRADLADWLGKTVFHELGEELMEELKNPFDTVINVTERQTYRMPQTLSTEYKWDPTEWLAFDTICWAVIIGLTSFAFFLLIKAAFILFMRKIRRFPPRKYRTLRTDEGSDSEELFDIRTHNNNP